MKNAILLAAMSLALIGCATPTNPEPKLITPARVQSVSKLASYASVRVLLLERPELRHELMLAAAGFNDLIQQERWDIVAIGAIAVEYGLPFLSSDEGQLILTGTFLFIDLLGGGSVDLADEPYAKAVVLGLRDGLNLALNVRVDATSTLKAEAQSTRN